MAIQDNFGRINEELNIADIVKQMKRPANNRVEVPKDKTPKHQNNPSYDKLVKLVEQFKNQSESIKKEFQGTQEWVRSFIQKHQEVKQTSKPDSKDKSQQEESLKRIAVATESLYKASQSQNTIWVGLCKLSTRAQKQIGDIFGKSFDASNLSKKFAANTRGGQNVFKSGRMPDPYKVIDKPTPAVNQKSSSVGRSNGQTLGPKDIDKMNGIFSKVTGKFASMTASNTIIAAMMEKTATSFLKAIDFDPLKETFQGVASDNSKYVENIRAVLQQQEGFIQKNKSAQQFILDIEKDVAATGASRAEYQARLLKTMERGYVLETQMDKMKIKGTKFEQKELALTQIRHERLKNIQNLSLRIADNLHLSGDAMTDMFLDWHFHLGKSEMTIGDMSRHMDFIAKSTGLTGSKLESSMKKTEAIIREIHKVGAASLEIMKQASSFSASSDKFGYDNAAGIMSALTDRMKFLESKERQFLMISGQMIDQSLTKQGRGSEATVMSGLMTGTLLNDKNGMKKLMEGQRMFAQQVFGTYQNVFDEMNIDISNLDPSNMIDSLNQLQKKTGVRQIDERNALVADNIKQRYRLTGIEIGDAQQLYNAGQEATMTPYDRLQKMQQRKMEMEAKKMQGTDEYSQLTSQISQANTDMAMNALSKINAYESDINAAGGMTPEIQRKIQTDLESVFGSSDMSAKWMNNIQGNIDGLMNDVDKRAKDAGFSLDSLLQERGVTNMQQFKQNLQAGGSAETTMLQNIISQISAKETAQSDPVTNMKHDVEQINNKLGQIAQDIRAWLGDGSMRVITGLSTIAGILSEILAAIIAYKIYDKFMGNDLDFPDRGNKKGKGKGRARAKGAKGRARIPRSTINSKGASIPKSGIPEIPKPPKTPGTPKIPNAPKGGVGMRGFGGGMRGFGGKALALGGKALGVFGSVLQVGEGMFQGASEAKNNNISVVEGGALGALTGDATTGSSLSPMLGVQQGGTVDKTLGVGGAAARGATIGAGIGLALAPASGGASIPIAAAIGGIVGAGAELVKILTEGCGGLTGIFNGAIQYVKDAFWEVTDWFSLTKESDAIKNNDDKMSAASKTLHQDLVKTAENIQDPVAKLAELERLLETQKISAQGAQTNVKTFSQDVQDSKWLTGNYFNRGLYASQTALDGEQSRLNQINSNIANLERKINELKKSDPLTKSMADNLEVTSKTMEMGQKKGSIYVHDTHCEAVLIALMKGLNLWNDKSEKEISELQKSLQQKAEEESKSKLSTALTGAFDYEGTKEGFAAYSQSEMSKLFANTPENNGEENKKSDSGSQYAKKENPNQNNLFNKILGMDTISSTISSVENFKNFIVDSIKEKTKVVSQFLNLGLFDDGLANEAQEAFKSTLTSQLFATDATSTLDKSLTDMKENSEKNVSMEISKALYYHKSNNDTNSEMNSTYMDYTDVLKGEMSTLGISRANIEGMIEKEKYTSKSGNTAVMPSIGEISDYLVNEQAHLLETISNTLVDIRNELRSSQQSVSQILRPIGNGNTPPQRSNFKNFSRDHAKGKWDLTFGDYSVGSTTTEGRGGNS